MLLVKFCMILVKRLNEELKSKYFAFLLIIYFPACFHAYSQLKVYHGMNGETQVYDEFNNVVNKPKINMKQGEELTVKIVNPNPLFYSYTLKYENLVSETEDQVIIDLLATFNTLIANRPGGSAFTGSPNDTK